MWTKADRERQSMYAKRANRFKKEMKARPTPQEMVVKAFLENHRIKFQFQKSFFKPFSRIVDFYIIDLRIIIEVDGPIHAEQKARDRNKDLTAFARGIETFRITNAAVDNCSYESGLIWYLLAKREQYLARRPKQRDAMKWIGVGV